MRLSAPNRPRGSDLLLALVGACFVAGLIAALTSSGTPTGTAIDLLVVPILALPVLAYFLRALAQPGNRLGWMLIGAGLVLNSAGEAWFYFSERTLTRFPTLGDFLSLGLFPTVLAGLVLLVRATRERARLSLGFDGIVIALAIAALAYQLIFDAVLRSAAASDVLVGGELAYPILDLAALTVLLVICVPNRFRVGGAYLWLLAGFATLLVTDVISLDQTAGGSAEPSTALYFGWGLAIVLLSLSSRFSAAVERREAFRGRYLTVALGGAMLLSLVLLLRQATRDQNVVVIAVSAVSLLLGLTRLFHTLGENTQLIEQRDRVIARQRQMETRLRFLAEHDPLTGMYNRRLFGQRVDEQMRYARRYEHSGALIFVDIDSFKFVNDSFGHAIGDQVLRRVAAAIGGSIRDTDTAARLGGDEFALLLPEVDEDGALHVTETVLGAIRAAREPMVGASAGIVLFGADPGIDAKDLFIAADIALYEAKDAGHGGISVYRGQKGMKLTWVERIRAALRENRLVLHAQPIVDLRSGEIDREELLVRMVDRDGAEIPPMSFLPTAERFGLIGDIDNLAVGKAIELARGGRRVAVNISGPALTDRGLVDRVAEAIAGGLDPQMLSFELTETAGVANIEAARRFAGYLENLGCDLALDDFGTGLSSLGYLKHIPIQTLKIDTEFIRSMSDSTFDRYLVQTIVNLARRLGQRTVAEGVEDEATLTLVRMFGVDFAQGYLLGSPAPIDPSGPRPISAAVKRTLASIR